MYTTQVIQLIAAICEFNKRLIYLAFFCRVERNGATLKCVNPGKLRLCSH